MEDAGTPLTEPEPEGTSADEPMPQVASAADPQPQVSEAEPPADIAQSRPAGEASEARPEAATPAADTPAEPVGDEPAPAPEPSAAERAAAKLFERVQAALGDAIVEHAVNFGDLVVRVRPDAWRRAAEVARDTLGCNYLSFISAIDWMPAPTPAGDDAGGDTSAPVQPKEMTFGVAGSAGRFQVFAEVQSAAPGHGAAVIFKTDVDENDPRVASWTPVYAGADWHERETWEMYGIDFDGHPAMRKLYLPSGFEGNPGRKEFPLLAREVKPWPGLVDVEPMPGEEPGADEATPEAEGG